MKIMSILFGNEPIYLTVQESPIATITSSTAITNCIEMSGGSVTFEISPENSGPWEIEYSIDDGPSKSVAFDTTPFVLPVFEPGTYELLNVISAAGCSGTIGQANMQQVKQPSDPFTVLSVSDFSICNDGSKAVDLNTDIIIEIENKDSILSGTVAEIGGIDWYVEDPLGLPRLLRSSIILSEASVIPIVTTDYFFVYTDQSACEIYGKTTIIVSEDNCIEMEPEVELAESITVPTLSQWGLLIFALLILNISLWLIRENEKVLL